MTNPAHVLQPAPGWAVHPTLITVADYIPGYKVARNVVPVVTFMGAPTVDQVSVVLAKLVQLLSAEASKNGANAIVGLKYQMLAAHSSGFIFFAYGSAVWVEYA